MKGRVLARLHNVLSEWIATHSWQASSGFAVAHDEELLNPDTLAFLDAIANQDLGDRVIRLHRGLLHYAAAGGFEMAYDLREDAMKRRAPSTAAKESLSTNSSWRWPVSRAGNPTMTPRPTSTWRASP
jgi:hypothetical protein